MRTTGAPPDDAVGAIYRNHVRVPTRYAYDTENHDVLMTDFGRGPATVTAGELTSVRHRALQPRDPGFHVMSDAAA